MRLPLDIIHGNKVKINEKGARHAHRQGYPSIMVGSVGNVDCTCPDSNCYGISFPGTPRIKLAKEDMSVLQIVSEMCEKCQSSLSMCRTCPYIQLEEEHDEKGAGS